MSTHNICFHGEIRKILCGYPLLSVTMLIYSFCFVFNVILYKHPAKALLMSIHNLFPWRNNKKNLSGHPFLYSSVLSNMYYGKCLKILYTKVSDKTAYANSADPDQTAPSDQGLHCLPFHSLFQEEKKLHKKQNLGPKSIK